MNTMFIAYYEISASPGQLATATSSFGTTTSRIGWSDSAVLRVARGLRPRFMIVYEPESMSVENNPKHG
eukprot:2700635-Rhodomonas_salina.5